jgi:hypothetical protein
MGLLEPYHMIVTLLFFGLIIVCPIWGYRAGAKRSIGAVGGLFLGLFLGLLGILIIYCTRRVDQKPLYNFPGSSPADELQKYKQLFDSGAITEAEYVAQKTKILNS